MIEKGYDQKFNERGKIIDNLYKQSTRPKIIQPTFVTDYPIELRLWLKATDQDIQKCFN